MLSKSQHLELKIKHIQKSLQSFPPGKIFITKNGSRFKWYHHDADKTLYIPKSKQHFAEQLSYKKYLTCLLDESIHEKKAIDFYLKHHNHETPKSQQLLTDLPEYQKLLSPFFQPLSKELKTWVDEPYPHNSNYPEQLNNRAPSGNMVRSKSEAMIDMLLYTNKIPFRYECELELDGVILYPDFTIRHPCTGRLFYWEHFGLMDNPDYSANAISKLNLYTSNGIIPSIDLITTYETKQCPLSLDEIDQIVKRYFL